jgi:hypothetical protein
MKYYTILLFDVITLISYSSICAQDNNLYYNTQNELPENDYFANEFDIFSGISYPFHKNINLNIETQISELNSISIGAGYYFPGDYKFKVLNTVDFNMDIIKFSTQESGLLINVFYRHYWLKYLDGANLSLGILHHRLPGFIFNEIQFLYGHDFRIRNRLSLKLEIGVKYCDYNGKIPFTSFTYINISPTTSLSIGYVFKIK